MLKNINIDIESSDLININLDYNNQIISLILTQRELESLFRKIDVTLLDKYMTEGNKNEY